MDTKTLPGKGLKNSKTSRLLFIVGFLITFFIGGLYLFRPSLLSLLELKLYDTMLARSHSPVQTNAVAIIDIDDKSLSRYGQWPWPRYRIAKLLEKINACAPAAVGLDILFSEPDRTSLSQIEKDLKKDFGIDFQFSQIDENLKDYDKILSETLKQGTFVLGYSAIFSKTQKNPFAGHIQPLAPAIRRSPGAGTIDQYLHRAKALIPPLPVLTAAATRTGFMNTIPDRDGVVRRTPLLLTWEENIYPQLALATLLAARKDRESKPVVKVEKEGIDAIVLRGTRIPLDEKGGILINYRGPSGTFPYFSAKDIMEDNFNKQNLKDRIVLLGTSASGLKDIRISPLDNDFPGIEVHATIIDNILARDFIQRPGWADGIEFSMILLWGFITTVLIGRSNAYLTLPATLFLAFGAWQGAVFSLKQLNIWVSPLYPILVLILNFTALNMQKYWLSEKRKKFFKNAFSKYVSRSIVDQLVKNPAKLSLTGEEKHISILFSDIREFTSIAEKLTPSQITLLLNEYFTAITKIIIKNKGTHDKFIGDAVMSFWNAPLDVSDHELCAVKSALEMITALSNLNADFEKNFGVRIKAGIGLHAGKCRVGNMGSDEIFDYTIIGDNVNLTSRLESLTKFYGIPLIVSSSILKGLPEGHVAQELDLVRVKGRDKPVRIFTIFADHNKERKKEIETHKQALSAYQNKDFKTAQTLFSKLSRQCSDQPLYTIFQKRCATLLASPPDKDWDGVFTHKEK